MKRFLLPLLCLCFVWTVNARVVDRILAVVNNKMVTQSDLDGFLKSLRSDGLVDNALLAFYDKDLIRKDRSYALSYLIDTKLIDSAVDRQGINVPIEAVEGEIRTIAQRSRSSKEQLVESLRQRGVPYSEYQHFVKTSMERQNLLKKDISSKIKISDEDIANHYLQSQKDSKALVFEYTLAHILFLPSNGGESAALERAQRVKELLDRGENFQAMAAKHSEDPRFSQGGFFGQVRAGDIVPQLERALAGVREGDTTQVVKMPDGLHIFKVLKRTLVSSADFERQKGVIADRLFSDIFARQYRNWIQEQRKAAYLKVHEK